MDNNCNLWNAKCTDLNNQCNNQNFNGPPNKGMDLTPPKATISPPPPLGPTRSGAAGAIDPGTTPVPYNAPYAAPAPTSYQADPVAPQYENTPSEQASAQAATTQSADPQQLEVVAYVQTSTLTTMVTAVVTAEEGETNHQFRRPFKTIHW
jgi:hypothetical protein